ncbi:MAG TPA: pyruvate kinase, partial [Bradyrhizobium sp.]
MRRAKIVATIGPASNSPEMLRKLITAGVDVARLNFSHGTHEQHERTIRAIREAAEAVGRPV